jgi:hypothetical protein
LDDQAQTFSYEHYYPYGGTALIAGKDKTKVQQKRYRYTGKERDFALGGQIQLQYELDYLGSYRHSTL